MSVSFLTLGRSRRLFAKFTKQRGKPNKNKKSAQISAYLRHLRADFYYNI
jgi:hypothetical protein